MSVNINVTVSLKTLTKFSDSEGRQDATEAVRESVVESLEAIPYRLTPKSNADGSVMNVLMKSRVSSVHEGRFADCEDYGSADRYKVTTTSAR